MTWTPNQPKRGESPSGVKDAAKCQYIKSGSCKNGDQCNFWHPQPCTYYQKNGTCVMGKWCVFEHDKPSGNPAQTSDQQKKKKGKKGSVAIAQDDIAQAAEDNKEPGE
jgi:hypothetical protein